MNEKLAQEMELTDEVLKFFEGKAENDSERSARFEELRERFQTDSLGEQLREIENGEANEELEQRLRNFADELRQEAEHLRQGKMEQLAEAEALALAAKNELSKKNESTNGQEQSQEGLEEEARRQQLAQNEESTPNASPGPGQGGGEGPGQGQQEDGKPGKAGGQGPSGGASLLESVASALKDTGDEELKRIATELTKAPEAGAIGELDVAMARISKLMTDLMGAASTNDSKELPSAYRRAVEDYYRALSDDES